MEFRCVECGFQLASDKALFIQYSPGNIRLMKCENCKAVADEYIECEIMILLIDLVLHKPKAYRHLLYNLLNRQVVNLEGLFWKSISAFLLLDAFTILVLNWSEENWSLSVSFSSLVLGCTKMLMNLLLRNFMFLCILLLANRYFLDAHVGVSRCTDILFAIFVSSYLKIFLITMLVWEFPYSVLFIIDMFVLSSNVVALKVMTESSIGKCIGTCFSAHAVKWLLHFICQDH
ncbi:protein ARV 2-like isoform X2 [Diospyros lotus]|uniref:protein ARV 2-like isoform X2 n=1 Tax=Diospyros lotus TaxID=55363 RepID=UPI00225187C7|nr:protein ARV 2-like isoform X2 [Diospyros lotus]